MYEYTATINRVVDGDTLDLDIDLGFHLTARVRVRLKDIDAPELRGPERTEGLAAKHFLLNLLTFEERVAVRTYKAGKYGRYIARIEVPGKGDLCELLVKEGHAVWKDYG